MHACWYTSNGSIARYQVGCGFLQPESGPHSLLRLLPKSATALDAAGSISCPTTNCWRFCQRQRTRSACSLSCARSLRASTRSNSKRFAALFPCLQPPTLWITNGRIDCLTFTLCCSKAPVKYLILVCPEIQRQLISIISLHCIIVHVILMGSSHLRASFTDSN